MSLGRLLSPSRWSSSLAASDGIAAAAGCTYVGCDRDLLLAYKTFGRALASANQAEHWATFVQISSTLDVVGQWILSTRGLSSGCTRRPAKRDVVQRRRSSKRGVASVKQLTGRDQDSANHALTTQRGMALYKWLRPCSDYMRSRAIKR